MKHYDHQISSKTMDETTFEWPEPTDEMLAALSRRQNTSDLQDMRDAIALDRRLLASNVQQIREAFATLERSGQSPSTWLLTRGGTVQPFPEPVPTLEQALEAALQLGGSQAEIVTRYLQAQRKRKAT